MILQRTGPILARCHRLGRLYDRPVHYWGMGEVPIVPPPGALANAIAQAVGVRMRQLPMTPERVFWAIREREGATALPGQ